MVSGHSSQLGELLTYPEWDIQIRKHINGLLISQRERTYLARKWQITSEVQDVIDTALSFGLTHLWQKGHPSKDESHHISFSFSHEPESWIFVIGGEAKPPHLKFVTFNKRFKAYFKDSGFEWTWEWENSGGKNILIQPRDLRTILEHLPLDEIKNGRLPKYDRMKLLDNGGTFIRSEAELEGKLYASYISNPAVIALHRQRSFTSNTPQERAARTDLIFTLDDRVVVAELKVGSSPEADVAQVRRYLENVALKSTYPDKPRFGTVIASNFQSDAFAEAERSSVSLYVYDESNGLSLRLVHGMNVLPAINI
jgi:hypothetical protein